VVFDQSSVHETDWYGHIQNISIYNGLFQIISGIQDLANQATPSHFSFTKPGAVDN
jgi:hypothetical protein